MGIAIQNGIKYMQVLGAGGGGGGSVELLFFLECVGQDTPQIPAIQNLELGDKFSEYLSFDSTTRKFTVIKDFSGIATQWVNTYRTASSSTSEGDFYINDKQYIHNKCETRYEGDKEGRSLAFKFSVGDVFWVYTPSGSGYPQQYCKVYLSDADFTNVVNFADDN